MAAFGDDGDGPTRDRQRHAAASPGHHVVPPKRSATPTMSRPRTVDPPPLPPHHPVSQPYPPHPRSEPYSHPYPAGPPPMPTVGRTAFERPQSGEPRTGPPTQPATQPGKRTARRKPPRERGLFRALVTRPAGILLRVMLVLLPLLGLAVGGLYLRLLHSPVSMSFLAGPIENSLNAGMPGFSLRIGDAILQRSDGGGIEFRLQDVRMSDSEGGVVALARQASVALDLWSLLALRVAPSRIDLIEPRFQLYFDDQGKLTLRSPSLDDAQPPLGPSPSPKPAAVPALPRPPATPADEAEGRKLEVARFLAQSMTRMRRDGQAVSRLTDFGVKNATIIIDESGRQTVWRIPEAEVDLHLKQKRSIVLGRAVIASAGDPWTLRFRVEESEKAKSVVLAADIENLNPRLFAQQVPVLAPLDVLEAPVAGKATLDLDLDGAVTGGTVVLDIGPGLLHAPWAGGPAISIAHGRMDLRYVADTGTLELNPSPLTLSIGSVTLAGRLSANERPGGHKRWHFAIASRKGVLSMPGDRYREIPIEELSLAGHHDSETGRSVLDRYVFKAGGVAVEAASVPVSTPGQTSVDIEGRIAAVDGDRLLAVWPRELAPRTRSYLAENLRKGRLTSGTFRVSAGDPGSAEEGRLALSLEVADVELEIVKGLPLLEMPRALVRVEGTSFELTIPEGQMTLGPNKRLSLKGGRFTTIGIDSAKPVAEIAGRIQGPLAAALDLADREPLALLKSAGVTLPPGIDGRLDVHHLKALLTLGAEIDPATLKLEAKARITDGRIRQILGRHDVTGATINIEATEKTVDVRGELLLAGVVGRLQGRWVAGAPDPKQPVGKLSVKIDDADRAQLGLDLDRLIRGPVPLDLLAFRTAGEQVKLKVVADLTASELMLDEVHWKKVPGRPARLEFDLGRDQAAKGLELQNFKLDGENIAIDGWVSLGPDNKARAFYFPEFLLNVVSNMEVQGTMRPERVWDIKVRGKNPFDAGEMLRALLVFDAAAERPIDKTRPGADVSAEFDTILGLNDLRLKQVRLKSQKRGDQLVAVDFSALLDSGRPLTGTMRPEPGRPRTLRIETTDAGQALKLIGFYNNMVGGNGILEINLDGRGAAEKQGVAQIKRFRVLGDQIASEVFQTPDDTRPLIDQARPGARRVYREEFEFDLLQAPFSVGNGQLIIQDAVARGPLLGTSLRGKIDFRTRRLNLGGTYVPFSGLNRAVSGVPLLGDLLTGPRGEGIFGLTFLVNGPMDNPQVTVNPFSGFTPGLLREFMQMVPENQTIAPRPPPARKAQPKGAGPQIRASPPTEADPGAADTPRVPAEVLDGWSTGTPVPTPRKR